MAKLIYSMVTSLDCYVEDEHGSFGWAAPDEEVNSYINELASSFGTYLYGRRMYEAMVYWETAYAVCDQPSNTHAAPTRGHAAFDTKLPATGVSKLLTHSGAAAEIRACEWRPAGPRFLAHPT
ncbi:MAG: dihydrofolate reductase family protein [Gammaproteobacteria bacterium]